MFLVNILEVCDLLHFRIQLRTQVLMEQKTSQSKSREIRRWSHMFWWHELTKTVATMTRPVNFQIRQIPAQKTESGNSSPLTKKLLQLMPARKGNTSFLVSLSMSTILQGINYAQGWTTQNRLHGFVCAFALLCLVVIYHMLLTFVCFDFCVFGGVHF